MLVSTSDRHAFKRISSPVSTRENYPSNCDRTVLATVHLTREDSLVTRRQFSLPGDTVNNPSRNIREYILHDRNCIRRTRTNPLRILRLGGQDDNFRQVKNPSFIRVLPAKLGVNSLCEERDDVTGGGGVRRGLQRVVRDKEAIPRDDLSRISESKNKRRRKGLGKTILAIGTDES